MNGTILNFFLKLSLVLSFLCLEANSYSRGAPIQACSPMMPNHRGNMPQTQPSPFSLNLSSTVYSVGETIKVFVKVARPMSDGYKGIFIQARRPGQTNPIGMWQNFPSALQALGCNNGNGNAITHTSSSLKNETTVFEWIAEENYGEVEFVFTVVQSFNTFWVGMRTPRVRFSSKEVEITTKAQQQDFTNFVATKLSATQKTNNKASTINIHYWNFLIIIGLLFFNKF